MIKIIFWSLIFLGLFYWFDSIFWEYIIALIYHINLSGYLMFGFMLEDITLNIISKGLILLLVFYIYKKIISLIK